MIRIGLGLVRNLRGRYWANVTSNGDNVVFGADNVRVKLHG